MIYCNKYDTQETAEEQVTRKQTCLLKQDI